MRRRRATLGRLGEPLKSNRGSGTQKPRGAPSASGWDLGRNDHTDEVGQERPAELFRCIPGICRLCAN